MEFKRPTTVPLCRYAGARRAPCCFRKEHSKGSAEPSWKSGAAESVPLKHCVYVVFQCGLCIVRGVSAIINVWKQADCFHTLSGCATSFGVTLEWGSNKSGVSYEYSISRKRTNTQPLNLPWLGQKISNSIREEIACLYSYSLPTRPLFHVAYHLYKSSLFLFLFLVHPPPLHFWSLITSLFPANVRV